jgi:hypothetical protein
MSVSTSDSAETETPQYDLDVSLRQQIKSCDTQPCQLFLDNVDVDVSTPERIVGKYIFYNTPITFVSIGQTLELLRLSGFQSIWCDGTSQGVPIQYAKTDTVSISQYLNIDMDVSFQFVFLPSNGQEINNTTLTQPLKLTQPISKAFIYNNLLVLVSDASYFIGITGNLYKVPGTLPSTKMIISNVMYNSSSTVVGISASSFEKITWPNTMKSTNISGKLFQTPPGQTWPPDAYGVDGNDKIVLMWEKSTSSNAIVNTSTYTCPFNSCQLSSGKCTCKTPYVTTSISNNCSCPPPPRCACYKEGSTPKSLSSPIPPNSALYTAWTYQLAGSGESYTTSSYSQYTVILPKSTIAVLPFGNISKQRLIIQSNYIQGAKITSPSGTLAEIALYGESASISSLEVLPTKPIVSYNDSVKIGIKRAGNIPQVINISSPTSSLTIQYPGVSATSPIRQGSMFMFNSNSLTSPWNNQFYVFGPSGKLPKWPNIPKVLTAKLLGSNIPKKGLCRVVFMGKAYTPQCKNLKTFIKSIRDQYLKSISNTDPTVSSSDVPSKLYSEKLKSMDNNDNPVLSSGEKSGVYALLGCLAILIFVGVFVMPIRIAVRIHKRK